MFLNSLLVWLLLTTLKKPNASSAAFIGFVYSFGALTKAVLLPYGGAIILCFFILASRKEAIKCSLLFLITVAAIITPWTIRNYKETGVYLPVSTGSGTNFWIGNYPGTYDYTIDSDNRSKTWPHCPQYLESKIKGMSEVERDHYLKQVAFGYIKENSTRAAFIFFHKFSDLWLGNIGAHTSFWIYPKKPRFYFGTFGIPVFSFLMIPIFIMAIIGIFSLKRNSILFSLPILFLLLVWTGVYVYIVSSGFRYCIPVYPYIIGFCTVAATSIFDRIKKHYHKIDTCTEHQVTS